MNKILLRIILDVFIFISIIQGWWFIVLPIGFIGVWKLPYFIELIVSGFVYDSLFLSNQGSQIVEHIGTIATIVIFCLVFGLKKILRR